MSEELKKYKTEVASARNKPSNIEAIRQWYLTEDSRHPVELTDAQQQHRTELLFVKAQLLRRTPEEDVRMFLMEDYGLSEATAYRRIREAISLYGDIKKADKEGRRWIIYEWTVYTFNEAATAKDYREMNRAVKNMITLLGLDKEDADTPDFEKLQASQVIAVLPEQMTDILLKALGKGPVSFNIPMDAEEAEYDEIITEPGGATPEGD